MEDGQGAVKGMITVASGGSKPGDGDGITSYRQGGEADERRAFELWEEVKSSFVEHDDVSRCVSLGGSGAGASRPEVLPRAGTGKASGYQRLAVGEAADGLIVVGGGVRRGWRWIQSWGSCDFLGVERQH